MAGRTWRRSRRSPEVAPVREREWAGGRFRAFACRRRARCATVVAWVETAAADSATLRNLLDKYGYASVEEIEQTKFEEGRAAGVAESILEMFDERGLAVSEEQAAKIRGCRDLKILRRWLRRAATAESVAAAID
jgi:hypothetical protein